MTNSLHRQIDKRMKKKNVKTEEEEIKFEENKSVLVSNLTS